MIRPVSRQCTEAPSNECAPGELIDKIISGDMLAADLSRQQEWSIRHWCRERTRASEATIQRLVDRGHQKNARRERLEHLKRREVLLDALFSSARKRWPTRTWMSAEQAERRRRKRLKSVFEQIWNVGKFGSVATARLFQVAKPNGGNRLITSFYWVDQARQRVLKSAFTPFADLHAAQFMLSHEPDRRGPATVRKALLTALAECGDDCLFMHFDVVRFYDAISHEWLESNLGIDHRVIRRQVHTGCMRIVPVGMTTVRDHHEAARERDRWGIPQGSALSPLIAEQVMASVLQSVAALDDLPVFAWSDNIGVIVPLGRARAIENLVRDAFGRHGAGPFQLTLSEHPVTSTFKFLGTWYRKTPDGPLALIPWQVMEAWEASIGSRLQVCWNDEIDTIERHVGGKAAQWRWFEPFREVEERVRSLIESRRSCQDPRFERRAA